VTYFVTSLAMPDPHAYASHRVNDARATSQLVLASCEFHF